MLHLEGLCFNPLAGIRCIQTEDHDFMVVDEYVRFNPLAGIRCIQTWVGKGART